MNVLNDPSELASFERFSLKEAHGALTGVIGGQPITLEVALINWGQIEEPYKAIYGQINAADVAQWWLNHRTRLFSDNIRNFIGLTDINEGIFDTLNTKPEHFIYFNNGITVLCRKISKKPIGGGDRSTGLFVCEGISIVNGAQTVGTIGNAAEKFPDKLEKAKIFVRFVSLENCPDDFGVRVTKATNTQNRIEKKDFISLDPEQERLKTELLLDGKNYHYKRTDEKIISDENNCTLEEATVALACLNSDVNLAVQAKREIGRLWEDPSKKPYTDIFNTSVSAVKIWRAIIILRDINLILKSKEDETQGKEKSFLIQGNRFLLHMVFQRSPAEALNNPNYDFELYRRTELPLILNNLISGTFVLVERNYPTALMHQLFKNASKCKDLATGLEFKLTP
jgi:hypothetical protein